MLNIKKAIIISRILLKNLILVILSEAKDLSVTCLKRFFARFTLQRSEGLRMTDNGKFVFNNLIFLSLILALFCLSGHLYAQTPPAFSFPPGREFDPRHPLDLRENGISPSAISENVEFVGATGGAVYDVFVQGNYAYLCAVGVLVILDISAPAHPTKVGYIALPDLAYGVHVSGSYAYVADGSSGLRVIDVSSPSNPREAGFYDTVGESKNHFELLNWES